MLLLLLFLILRSKKLNAHGIWVLTHMETKLICIIQHCERGLLSASPSQSAMAQHNHHLILRSEAKMVGHCNFHKSFYISFSPTILAFVLDKLSITVLSFIYHPSIFFFLLPTQLRCGKLELMCTIYVFMKLLHP